jgi:ADP-ribose pyrophosphatase YjhB (NUDIX family)
MSDSSAVERAHEGAKALLLEDYRYSAESFWKNEQGGETRVNLFIGLVTLVIGGLASLTTGSSGLRGEPLRIVILAGLAALSVLGHITLLKMLIRNKRTDECKRSLDIVRQAFKDHFDESGVLLGYYPIKQGKKNKKEGLRKFGGLAHTVAAINSLLLAGFAGILVYPVGCQKTLPHMIPSYILGAATFFLALVKLREYIAGRENKAKEEIRTCDPNRAGGIVCKYEKDVVKYLIVGPKDKSKGWVLPKGRLEKGESHGEAALREVLEETGVVAKIVCPAGIVEFETDEGKNIVKFYLMEFLFEQGEGDGREKRWKTMEEVLLSKRAFPETELVLQLADKKRIERGLLLTPRKTRQPSRSRQRRPARRSAAS